MQRALASAFVLALLAASPARADELFVGGASDAHATIQDALGAATDGDVITIRAGTYTGELVTRAPGVTLRAEPGGGEVLVTADGRVLDVQHARTTVEDLVLDGQYGAGDGVRVEGDGFTMRGTEVRRVSRDCVDLRAVSDVLIDGCLLHHCLSSTAPGCDAPGCREDAHGIVAGTVRNVTIRDTEIHSFSGDAFQADPGRGDAGWTDVLIEGCLLWSGPLATAEGGYAAGVNPAENAVDTKTSDTRAEPAVLTIRDTVAWGFRGGLISNMAAFNLKENVRVLLDGVTVRDSEIAFRVRGATSSRPRGAQATIQNTVVYDVDTAVRYEDGLDSLALLHCTLGGEVGRAFNDQSRDGPSTIDGRNVLVLGSLSGELMGGSNLSADATFFVDATGHDYHLADGSPAINAGEMLAAITADREGNARPQGGGWDVGAYEHCGAMCVERDAGPGPRPDGGVPPDTDGGTARPDGSAGDGGAPGADAGTGGEADGGCGCRASGQSTSGGTPLLLGLLTLLAIAHRRRG